MGYTYVETPWVVPREVSEITYQGDALSCQLGDLVGSAEQGFLALPEIKDAKLVSCGPCFRNEPVIDAAHQSWFMKIELYQSGDHFDEIIFDANSVMREAFIRLMTPYNARGLTQVATPEGADLMLNGIEVGSYGVRTVGNRTWTYGTGLALPRFMVAIDNFSR